MRHSSLEDTSNSDASIISQKAMRDREEWERENPLSAQVNRYVNEHSPLFQHIHKSMTAHARLSPSAAHRWVNCTASVAFIEELREAGTIGPDSSSEYADDGTEAHSIASAILLGQPVPEVQRKRGETDETFAARQTETMANVNAYVAWVRAWHGKATKQTLWVERKVELFYAPGQKGTTDATVWGKSFIFVGDYKNGVGVSVEAQDNKQLAIYAESVIREIEQIFEVRQDLPVHLGIFQPRDRNNPEPERLWTLTRAQLADFCAGIEHAANVVTDGGSQYHVQFVANPEVQCRFCPAKGACKAYAGYGLSVVTDDVDKIPATVLPSPNALTREQRQKIIAAKKPLTDWLAAVEEQEMAELLAGAPPLQFKLVAGKSNRQWADEDAADKLLKNYLSSELRHPPSDLISPTQAEKLLKGIETSTRFVNALERLITKPSGKPTLVPIDDKRPALQIDKAEGLTAVPSLDEV